MEVSYLCLRRVGVIETIPTQCDSSQNPGEMDYELHVKE